MKILVIVLFVVGLLAGVFFIFAPDSTSKTAGETMNFETIKANISSGGILLDVRTAEEFSQGHIDGAVNLPLDKIQAGDYPSVDKNASIYVYCRSGNRSATAANLLKNAGFTNVTDLGAMTSVAALGGKVVN